MELREQQNMSNLQSLETEVTLTKAEMEEFRKLPREEQEKQKTGKLEELKVLQKKLDQIIQESIKTGNIEDAQELSDQLEREIYDLEKKFYLSEISPEDEAIFQEIHGGSLKNVFKLKSRPPEIDTLINILVIKEIKDHVFVNLDFLTSIIDEEAKILIKNYDSLELRLDGLIYI